MARLSEGELFQFGSVDGWQLAASFQLEFYPTPENLTQLLDDLLARRALRPYTSKPGYLCVDCSPTFHFLKFGGGYDGGNIFT